MKLFKRTIIILCWLLFFGFVYFSCHFWYSINKTKPKDILTELNLELPEYEVISEDDNLNRSASAWDWYHYEVRFSTQNPETVRSQLIDKDWDCEEGEYSKIVGLDSDVTYSARVFPFSGTAILEIERDEYYGLADLAFGIFMLIVAIVIGCGYGFIKLALYLRSRRTNSMNFKETV